MTGDQDSESPREETARDAVHAVMVEIQQDFFRFLARRLGNEDEAADVLHDFYVKVLTRVDDVRDTEKLRAWMRRVLETSLIDYYRAQGKKRQADAEYHYLESALLTGDGKGDLDLVMGRMPAPENMTSLRFEPLYRDRVVFIVHNTHPLSGQRQVAADILSRYPVLVPPAGSIIHPFVERVMLEQGMAPPVQAVETVSDSFGRAFLRSTNAIWIISRGVVAAELASGEFIELPIDTGSTMGAVGLITRDIDRPHDAALFFADILRRRSSQS